MEKRLSKKVENYITQFKEDLKNQALDLKLDEESSQKMIGFIFDYERMTLNKDDFIKRKRMQNMVPQFSRCCAKRSNGEQCSRKKKDDSEYCGTHIKGSPHGLIDQFMEPVTTMKIEVWAQDIKGIIYYIDKFMNVYQAEDIIRNKSNPKIIAKYIKTQNEYHIPDFGI